MTVFMDPVERELIFQANSLDDAIELVAASSFEIAKQGRFRLETLRSQYLRLVVPIADWPCHSHPEGKKKWCDHSGAGGFMGHTCHFGRSK